MSEGGKQDVGITIIEPGAEISTTLAAGLVVQISNLPDGMQAANDDNAQSQSDSGS